MATLNKIAKAFRDLHQPGNPLLVANVYDGITAQALASMPQVQVLGTASFSVAAAAGLSDEDLGFETNIRAARVVGAIGARSNKLVTIDFQDGYGEQLPEGIKELIDAGVVGINLEDTNKATGELYSAEKGAERVKLASETAKIQGVPDFVVNARIDTLIHGNSIEDAIRRGQAYLEAGAANVFVWGGSKREGVTEKEIVDLTRALDGKLNVMATGILTIKQLAEIGVARCSVGPTLQFAVAAAVNSAAEKYLST